VVTKAINILGIKFYQLCTEFQEDVLAKKSFNKRELARRYGRAFSDALVTKNDKIELENFLTFCQALVKSDSFKKMVTLDISVQNKMDIVVHLAQKANLSDISQNFLKLIISRGRIALLPEIVSYLYVCQLDNQGKIDVSVTLSGKITDEQQQEMSQIIQSVTLKTAIMNIMIDETIISGYILKIGNKLIDNSMKNKLKRLHQTMKGVI
jgi:F-type H+-transporting ATPase subunit delta